MSSLGFARLNYCAGHASACMHDQYRPCTHSGTHLASRCPFQIPMLLHITAQAVAFGQGVASLLPQLSALTEILPPPTLAWKLQLLQEGNR